MSSTVFPGTAVEYFVSYYDYYQPEAYIPAGDLYIEKEATINEELDKLRLSATRFSLSVPRCHHRFFGLLYLWSGSPKPITAGLLLLEKGQRIAVKTLLAVWSNSL